MRTFMTRAQTGTCASKVEIQTPQDGSPGFERSYDLLYGTTEFTLINDLSLWFERQYAIRLAMYLEDMAWEEVVP